MRKCILVVFILIISVFSCNDVFAEVDYSDTSCNYNSKAYLNKLAYNVTASYEFKKDENGNYSFDISIYNIVDDIYVTYKDKEAEGEAAITVLPSMANNGVYTFNVPDTTNIITYEIVVRTLKFGCINDIRKFTVVKPKRNSYYDLDICKYDEVVDYLYCREWVAQEFNLTDREIRTKIENKRKEKKEQITTKCVSCDNDARNSAKQEQFQMIKKFVVIGLSIGIVIDMIVIYFLVSNIRRSEI